MVSLDYVHGTVIVAVVVMGVVQVAIDQIIDMVAVRDRLMTATRAMDMVSGMSAALVTGCAAVGVLAAGFQ